MRSSLWTDSRPGRVCGSRRWAAARSFLACAALAGAAVPAGPDSVVAQEATVTLDAGGSYSLPPAGGTGEANEYLHAALRLAGMTNGGAYAHVGGYGGLSLSETGASWGSLLAGVGVLTSVAAGVALGIGVTGEAFSVGSPFPYRAATLRAEPELRVGSGGTTMRVAGYGAIGSSEVTVVDTFYRDTRFGRALVEVGTDLATNLWSWGGALTVRQHAGKIIPWIGVEAYDSRQGRYVAGRAGLEARLGAAVVTVEGALWDTPDGEEATLVAGLRVFTGTRASFLATGGRYGPDPLLDSPVGGSAAATVTWEAARFVPRSQTWYEIAGTAEKTVTLALVAPDAASVSVTGDFTDWAAVPLMRDEDAWVIELPVEAGVHHYGFLVDGAWYVPPDAPGRVKDEWGGEQAALLVPEDPQ